MRRLLLTLVPLVALGILPAQAGPNVPLCLAIQKNLVDCQNRQERERRHWEWERYRDFEEGDDWDEPWEHHRRGPPDEGCAAWVVALQANHCF